jgi:hypothetical protein
LRTVGGKLADDTPKPGTWRYVRKELAGEKLTISIYKRLKIGNRELNVVRNSLDRAETETSEQAEVNGLI